MEPVAVHRVGEAGAADGDGHGFRVADRAKPRARAVGSADAQRHLEGLTAVDTPRTQCALWRRVWMGKRSEHVERVWIHGCPPIGGGRNRGRTSVRVEDG